MNDAASSQNWAGNVRYSARRILYPQTVKAVQEAVRQSAQATVLGSRHSFNTIADSTDTHICLDKLDKIIALDTEARTVTIEAGVRYSQLAPYLHQHGFALHNMASLPHISVAGSCATATHGSGLTSGNLATFVIAIEFADASGNLIKLTKADKEFDGAIVLMGALGVVTRLTLAIEPTFQMQQNVYRNLAMSKLQDNFESLQTAGYSVSLFTDWKDRNINQVWILNKSDQTVSPHQLDLYGMEPAVRKLHPVAGMQTDPVTEQLGVPGPWFERMPHFKIGHQPSVGNELQSEYFVPIEHAYDAMVALQELQERLAPHLYVSEIRTVGADTLWMSPCHNRRSVAFHMTWCQHPEVVQALIPAVEAALEPFEPRPHWGKLFTMDPARLQSCYERLDDFKRFAATYDPHGKFRNKFLTETLYS